MNICLLSACDIQDKTSGCTSGYSRSIESVIYRLYMSLVADLLEKLKYGFAADAINFVGVHQERMHQVSMDFSTVNLI